MSIISSIMSRRFMRLSFHQPWLAAVPYPCGYVTISGKDCYNGWEFTTALRSNF